MHEQWLSRKWNKKNGDKRSSYLKHRKTNARKTIERSPFLLARSDPNGSGEPPPLPMCLFIADYSKSSIKSLS